MPPTNEKKCDCPTEKGITYHATWCQFFKHPMFSSPHTDDWKEKERAAFENAFLIALGERVLKDGNEYVEKNVAKVYLECSQKASFARLEAQRVEIAEKVRKTPKRMPYDGNGDEDAFNSGYNTACEDLSASIRKGE